MGMVKTQVKLMTYEPVRSAPAYTRNMKRVAVTELIYF